MESGRPARIYPQPVFRSCLRGFAHHARWYSRREHQPAHRRTARNRSAPVAEGDESILWTDSAIILTGRSHHSGRTTPKALSRISDGCALQEQRWQHGLSRRRSKVGTKTLSRAVVPCELYPFQV